VRKGFNVLNERKGWVQRPRPTTPFDFKNFTGKYAREIWTEMDKPEDYDPKASGTLKSTKDWSIPASQERGDYQR